MKILGIGVSMVLALGLAGCGGDEGRDAAQAVDIPESAASAPTWPTATATVTVSATQKISGTFDGGMKRYVGSGPLGSGSQSESQPAMFQLADGATLSNVILGNPAADGVHCLGTCTLKNVWWEDVGEDAATMEASSKGAMTIDGGGARSASDKIFQHNGSGTMTIRNFYAEDFGKLYRACGNCTGAYQGQRHVVIQNIVVTKVNTAIAGINSNYGDTADMSGLTILGDTSHKTTICVRYQGNSTGAEPTKLGSGPGSGCNYDPHAISWTATTDNRTLTVTRSGTGSGTVSSSPSGISCGSACSANFASGTSLTLTASPASGSMFARWSGACSGTGSCTVTMSANQSVAASFAGPVNDSFVLAVTKSGTGSGTVSSNPGGISCGSTCQATYAAGTSVSLTAAPASGSTFGGWGGACSGTATTCTVSMNAARSITATFTGSAGNGPCPNPITVTTGNSGNFNTTGAACYRTSAAINGWGCFNMDGRTVSVNGAATTCGTMPVAKWTDGYAYFAFSAGTYPWAGFYYW